MSQLENLSKSFRILGYLLNIIQVIGRLLLNKLNMLNRKIFSDQEEIFSLHSEIFGNASTAEKHLNTRKINWNN